MEQENKNVSQKSKYTFLGFLGVLIWGASNAFGRSLAETFGNFSSTGLTNIGAGIISTIYQIRKTGIESYKRAPLRYWLTCGILYVVYKLSTNLAVGVAVTREQVVTSGLIRVMWPLLTLIVAVIMFRDENKVSKAFPAGIILSALGILVANTEGDSFSLINTLKVMFGEGFWASALSVVSCISWAFYSNLNRKIVGEENYDAAGLFMIITGVIAFAVTFFIDEPQHFYMQQIGEVIYIVVFSSFLGTLFWNSSMQKGNQMLVVFAANFIPVFSTVISALFLGVKVTPFMVIGSILVVAGTIWCKKCVTPVEQ
ncbi:MAG TPA: EamA family transporter [Candidatus Avilachnospira avicola]|nr:EamA family transporter [Candidatus Avilachnospira avicola]